MNILFFLTPKSDIAYIFENETLRQTLEKMEHRKFSCIPILNPDGKYVGTISEGDLLWGMKNLNITDMKTAEEVPVMAATTWRWMYDSTYGIINSLLISLGVTKIGIPWLSDPNLTLLTTMIVNIWRGIPFFMFSILGALQTLEKQQYEAAYVDGAGAFKQFWYITLPSISSVIGITTLLSTIWTFNDFENVYLITGGGPLYASSTIATYTYDMAFIQNNFARAVSVAISVIPLLLILIFIYAKANKEEE